MKNKPLFAASKTVATPAALDMLRLHQTDYQPYLNRHYRGDWGDLDRQDKAANNEALKTGARILSSYKITRNDTIWIITEAAEDPNYPTVRSITTILLPEDY